ERPEAAALELDRIAGPARQLAHRRHVELEAAAGLERIAVGERAGEAQLDRLGLDVQRNRRRLADDQLARLVDLRLQRHDLAAPGQLAVDGERALDVRKGNGDVDVVERLLFAALRVAVADPPLLEAYVAELELGQGLHRVAGGLLRRGRLGRRFAHLGGLRGL